MLEERFELCNNIKIYSFDFLSILNYNTYIDLKNISVKDLISNMDLENIKITNKILTNHKNNIIIILNKVYIVKQLDGDDGSIRREYIIRELNQLYSINISNSMKIEVILNIYKTLFDYFYSIWNKDNDINSIIKIIFPTQDKYY